MAQMGSHGISIINSMGSFGLRLQTPNSVSAASSACTHGRAHRDDVGTEPSDAHGGKEPGRSAKGLQSKGLQWRPQIGNPKTTHE